MCGNREIGEGKRGFAPATSDGKSAFKEEDSFEKARDAILAKYQVPDKENDR